MFLDHTKFITSNLKYVSRGEYQEAFKKPNIPTNTPKIRVPIPREKQQTPSINNTSSCPSINQSQPHPKQPNPSKKKIQIWKPPKSLFVRLSKLTIQMQIYCPIGELNLCMINLFVN